MAATVTDSKDGVSYAGALTADAIVFTLLGGKYSWGTSAPSTSTTLEVLMPDGSTYQAVVAAVTAAGVQALDLPPGTYKIIFTATGAVTGFVQRIPYSPSY